MAHGTAPERWVREAAPWVAALTLLRVGLLWLDRTEAAPVELLMRQHGLVHAPLTSWLAGLGTLAGPDPFWIRWPAPILHGLAAMAVGGIAARLFGPRTAVFAALGWATMPLVALASLVLLPETVMAPLLAASFALYLRLLDRQEPWVAGAAGALFGLAALAHAGALLAVGCAVAAGAVFAEARPHLRNGAILAGACLAVLVPSGVWAVLAAPPVRAGWPDGAALPAAAMQALGPGPVMAAALVAAALGWRRQAPVARFLLLFALPLAGAAFAVGALWHPFALTPLAAWIAGTPVAIVWLRARRRWLAASLALGVAASLALPLAAVMPERVGLLHPLQGRAEASATILDIATDLGVPAVVAAEPDLALDLSEYGRGRGVAVHRSARHGALPAGRDVLLVLPADAKPPCPADVMDLAELDWTAGAYRARPQALYLVPGACLER